MYKTSFKTGCASINILIWHWLMYYICSLTYYILCGWLLIELCWNALTWARDWLSSPVPDMACFHFSPPLGFSLSHDPTASDELYYITSSISVFVSRERKRQCADFEVWLKAIIVEKALPFFMPSGHMMWFYAPKQIKSDRSEIQEGSDSCLAPQWSSHCLPLSLSRSM